MRVTTVALSAIECAACAFSVLSCGAVTGIDFPLHSGPDSAVPVAVQDASTHVVADVDAASDGQNDASENAATDAAEAAEAGFDARVDGSLDCSTDSDCGGGEFCSPSGCTHPIAIATGYDLTCEMTSLGGAECWGDNTYGELGNGTTTASLTPVAVSGLSAGVSAVTAGGAFACALTKVGAVRCWGNNEFASSAEIDSTVPVVVSGLTSGAKAISAGLEHVCAVDANGGVVCWGNNAFGQLGNGSTTNSSVPVHVSGLGSGVAALAAGSHFSCALTGSGQVSCWGDNQGNELANGSTMNSDVPVVITSLPPVVTIAAGGTHACAVTSAGSMSCWGAEVSVAVTGLSAGVAAVAAGADHTCVLTTAGGVECWGSNNDGQLGNDSTTDSNPPVPVSGLSSGVVSIAAGDSNSCAVTAAGVALCWGANTYGQLGDDTTTTSLFPVRVVEP